MMEPQTDKNMEPQNIDPSLLMGIGSWHPQWLQRFNNPKAFVILVSLLGVLEGSWFPYNIAIISTLEKRYSFDSSVTGLILIADNISMMLLAPIVGYIGKKMNQAHLLGIGMLLVGVSCFINVIPYFVYGPGLHLISSNVSLSKDMRYDLCYDKFEESCNTGSGGDENAAMLAVSLLWMASFVDGFGYTILYIVALPFIDDNVDKKDSSIYLSKFCNFVKVLFL